MEGNSEIDRGIVGDEVTAEACTVGCTRPTSFDLSRFGKADVGNRDVVLLRQRAALLI